MRWAPAPGTRPGGRTDSDTSLSPSWAVPSNTLGCPIPRVPQPLAAERCHFHPDRPQSFKGGPGITLIRGLSHLAPGLNRLKPPEGSPGKGRWWPHGNKQPGWQRDNAGNAGEGSRQSAGAGGTGSGWHWGAELGHPGSHWTPCAHPDTEAYVGQAWGPPVAAGDSPLSLPQGPRKDEKALLINTDYVQRGDISTQPSTPGPPGHREP